MSMTKEAMIHNWEITRKWNGMWRPSPTVAQPQPRGERVSTDSSSAETSASLRSASSECSAQTLNVQLASQEDQPRPNGRSESENRVSAQRSAQTLLGRLASLGLPSPTDSSDNPK